MRTMRGADVQTTVHYPCVHQFSYFRALFPMQSLRKSEVFAARELALPLHPKLETANIDVVVDALGAALRMPHGTRVTARNDHAA